MPPDSIPPPLLIMYSALALWGLSAVAAILRGRSLGHGIFSLSMLAGSLLIFVASAMGFNQDLAWTAPPPIYLAVAPLANRVDELSSIFLLLLSTVSACCALYSPGYLAHFKDKLHPGVYWSCLFAFLISMTEVIVSANALTFLLFWELMSLSSVFLVACDFSNHKAARAAIIYLAATRVATAFLAGGFLWLHDVTGSWDFAGWDLSGPKCLVPVLLIFAGLAIKAGLWPFHLWLPYAHPAAPAPVSALMSGVMIKLAIYAVVRIVIFGGFNNEASAYVIFAMATISSFWGILFALAQQDLKALLAYSSIENVGMIMMALSLAIICRATGIPELAALALAAAMMHSLFHGLFKSLLFLGAGAVDAQAGTRDLEMLGGLVKKMPVTTLCFLTGSLSICSLPPLNGFASKWLIYQSLFGLACDAPALAGRAVALAAIGVLALVGGLAVACFTRAVGIAFLGRARAHSVEKAHEATPGMQAAQAILAVACVLSGLMVPSVLAAIEPAATASVSTHAHVAGSFSIPQPFLALTLVLTAALSYFVMLKGRHQGLRQYITWECGYGDLPTRTEETASSFSEPIEHIFGPLLGYRIKVIISGRDRRHFPERVKEETEQVSLLETNIYTPAVAAINWLSQRLAAIQSGSIHLYLLYMLVTLVLLMTIGTRL